MVKERGFQICFSMHISIPMWSDQAKICHIHFKMILEYSVPSRVIPTPCMPTTCTPKELMSWISALSLYAKCNLSTQETSYLIHIDCCSPVRCQFLYAFFSYYCLFDLLNSCCINTVYTRDHVLSSCSTLLWQFKIFKVQYYNVFPFWQSCYCWSEMWLFIENIHSWQRRLLLVQVWSEKIEIKFNKIVLHVMTCHLTYKNERKRNIFW